jgi:hypothetical protein
VPTWAPATDEARALQAGALRSAQVRADIEVAMKRQTYTAEGTALERTLRFLAAPTDVNWGGKVHGGRVFVGRRGAVHERESSSKFPASASVEEEAARGSIRRGQRSTNKTVRVISGKASQNT